MEVDVCIEDRFVNIVQDGLDAGIRLVEAIDRDMVHVRLSGACRVVVAAGVGLLYTLEPLIAEEIARGRLRVALEPFAPEVPRLFLYFPSRGQTPNTT